MAARSQSQPVAPGPIEMTRTQDALSMSASFEDHLDQHGRALYQHMQTEKKEKKAFKKVQQASADVAEANLKGFRANKGGNWTYEDLIRSFLYPTERVLLGGQMLPYWSIRIEYLDSTGFPRSPPLVRTMTQGRLLLTSNRLLVLTADAHEETHIEQVSTPVNTRNITVQAQAQDTVSYLPVPINCFRSIELVMSHGTTTTATIYGFKTALCCFGCCPRDRYEYRHPSTVSENQRHLVFGVLMPPWGAKVTMDVHIKPEAPLALICDFISVFQHIGMELAVLTRPGDSDAPPGTPRMGMGRPPGASVSSGRVYVNSPPPGMSPMGMPSPASPSGYSAPCTCPPSAPSPDAPVPPYSPTSPMKSPARSALREEGRQRAQSDGEFVRTSHAV